MLYLASWEIEQGKNIWLNWFADNNKIFNKDATKIFLLKLLSEKLSELEKNIVIFPKYEKLYIYQINQVLKTVYI